MEGKLEAEKNQAGKNRKWIDEAEVVQPIINRVTTLSANHQ